MLQLFVALIILFVIGVLTKNVFGGMDDGQVDYAVSQPEFFLDSFSDQ